MALCECGCGLDAGTYIANDKRWGYVKGESRRFIPGHVAKGKNHYNWKNGKTIRYDGRIMLYTGGISRKYESRQVVEDIIGKPLPPQAVIHHIDHEPSNNDPSNLVICNDHAHHRLIHARETAYLACGHANWRKCRYCGEYDDPKNLHEYGINKISRYHNHCNTLYHRERRERIKNAENRLPR